MLSRQRLVWTIAPGQAGTTIDRHMTPPNQAVHIDTVMRRHDALNAACRYRSE